MNDFIPICSWLRLAYICRFMQPSLFFFRLLVTQSNWKISHQFHLTPPLLIPPKILHFTHSSAHSNVQGRERDYRGGEIESNQIPPKLHGARRGKKKKKEKSIDPKGKGICYLTPAMHLISPETPQDNQPLGRGVEKREDFSSAQTS